MVCHRVLKKRGLIKRIISMMAAVLIMCGIAIPAVSVNAGNDDSDNNTPQDENYIVVEKEFVGIREEQIPEKFQITVQSSSGQQYVLNKENRDSWEQTGTEEGTIIWRWKIMGVGTGDYVVGEQNYSVSNYDVIKNGEGTVRVQATEFNVEIVKHETTCSITEWSVKIDGDSNVLFAATLTQGGVAVISKEPLSASQREVVAQKVLTIKGPWKTPVYFYSIAEQMKNGTGFVLNGATITYDPMNETINIGKTSDWQHVARLEYSISDASNPEIGITNTYTPITRDIVVKKAVSGGLGDTQKEFNFNYSYTNTEGNPVIGKFTLKNGEEYTITGVPLNGVLEIKETNADGYDTTATYKGESVEVTGEKADETKMLSITVVDGEYEIVVHNHKDVNPDMGIQIGTFPYVLLMILVVAGVGFMLFGRVKRRDV